MGTPHTGKIRLPDGTEIPAGVISSTGKNDKTGEVFFVMALPSVWKAANVRGALPDSLGLKGVFLHEFMHVTQLPIIQPAFDSAMEGLGQWVAYSWLSDPKGRGDETH